MLKREFSRHWQKLRIGRPATEIYRIQRSRTVGRDVMAGGGGEVREEATLRTCRAPYLLGVSFHFQLSAYILDLICLYCTYIHSLCFSFAHAPAQCPYHTQGGGGEFEVLLSATAPRNYFFAE